MRFQIIECDQRSEMWFAARAGRLTGSCAKAMLTKTKTKGTESAARRDLRIKLALERITGKPHESDYVGKDMQRGIDLEPVARQRYEAETGYIVESIGFCSMVDWLAGCSLDGMVDNFTGIQEIKCPRAATHLETLQRQWVPSEYHAQTQHNLWVTGAQWVDYVSYCEDFPEEGQYFCRRIERSEFDMVSYEREVNLLLAEVSVDVEEINKTLAKQRERRAA